MAETEVPGKAVEFEVSREGKRRLLQEPRERGRGRAGARREGTKERREDTGRRAGDKEGVRSWPAGGQLGGGAEGSGPEDQPEAGPRDGAGIRPGARGLAPAPLPGRRVLAPQERAAQGPGRLPALPAQVPRPPLPEPPAGSPCPLGLRASLRAPPICAAPEAGLS